MDGYSLPGGALCSRVGLEFARQLGSGWACRPCCPGSDRRASPAARDLVREEQDRKGVDRMKRGENTRECSELDEPHLVYEQVLPDE